MITELRAPALAAATTPAPAPGPALVPPAESLPATAPPPRRSRARLDVVGDAAVRALAYADVFDWPLTVEEIHRWLPLAATLDEVRVSVARLTDRPHRVERSGAYVTLPERSHLAAERRRRLAVSARLWPRAVRLAAIVGGLPFVRLVAVTGSLAVNAATDLADVDLMVVTADGRLWSSRAMAMGVVRFSSVLGIDLCPNYLVTESSLSLPPHERNLFTAHELVQTVPIGPAAFHDELLRRNAWYREFLPNAHPSPARRAWPMPPKGLRQATELALSTRVVDRFERWEMGRKVARLSAASTSAETRYDATCCKGHADEHGRRVMAAYEARLDRLEGGT